MARYKLIDAITQPVELRVLESYKGYKRMAILPLSPGEEYETDDDLLITSLKGTEFERRYSEKLVNALDEYDIPYTKKLCKVCGGKVQKIKYHPVEVSK